MAELGATEEEAEGAGGASEEGTSSPEGVVWKPRVDVAAAAAERTRLAECSSQDPDAAPAVEEAAAAAAVADDRTTCTPLPAVAAAPCIHRRVLLLAALRVLLALRLVLVCMRLRHMLSGSLRALESRPRADLLSLCDRSS